MNSNGDLIRAKRKRILLLALGIILLVLGIVAILAGAAIFYLNMGTDAEGYTVSPVYQIRSSANAFALGVKPLNISKFSWLGEDNIAETKWIIKAVDGGKQVFAGWCELSDVEVYLYSFRYETPYPNWTWPVGPYYARINVNSTRIYHQGAPSHPPTSESFWIESVVTGESATIYWDPTWAENTRMKTLVIMNADGSSGVNADLQLGFKVPILTWLPYLLILLGSALCFAGFMVLRRLKKLVS